MVVSLKPSKFYGSSLPRPRIYVSPDGSERIDPPTSVTGPLMSWAEEAHWSMGGLSFKRLRLMGKIEGNVKKLRSQKEKEFKAHPKSPSPSPKSDLPRSKSFAAGSRSRSPSPPPAPIGLKRRRLEAILEEENEEIRVPITRRRRLVKKLGDDFDRVASPVNVQSTEVAVVSDASPVTPVVKRSRRLVKFGDAVKKVAEEKLKKVVEEEEKSPNSVTRVRVSPRLAKIGSN